jgi:hypothetical protein
LIPSCDAHTVIAHIVLIEIGGSQMLRNPPDENQSQRITRRVALTTLAAATIGMGESGCMPAVLNETDPHTATARALLRSLLDEFDGVDPRERVRQAWAGATEEIPGNLKELKAFLLKAMDTVTKVEAELPGTKETSER